MKKLSEGQILYTHHMDDIKYVHFYQVTRATSNTCELRELRKKITTQNFDEQEVIAIKDDFVGETMRRRVQKSGCVMIDTGTYAWPWDGTGIWQTVIIYMP